MWTLKTVISYGSNLYSKRNADHLLWIKLYTCIITTIRPNSILKLIDYVDIKVGKTSCANQNECKVMCTKLPKEL